MEKDSLIYVAGHRGLVGSAICRNLGSRDLTRLLAAHARRARPDRRGRRAALFEQERPRLCLSGRGQSRRHSRQRSLSGGLHPRKPAHSDQRDRCQPTAPASTGCSFWAPVCIYPKLCPQPIKEEYLLTGPLEPTNRPYALAKIAGIEMCWSYNRQYGTRYLAAMPTNLYGPGDNFDLQNSHVLPALIRKVAEAKAPGQKQIVVWGTGTPRRELLFSEDLAEACVFLMNLAEDVIPPCSEDVAADQHRHRQDVTIRELAEQVCARTGFQRRAGLRHHKARRNAAESCST